MVQWYVLEGSAKLQGYRELTPAEDIEDKKFTIILKCPDGHKSCIKIAASDHESALACPGIPPRAGHAAVACKRAGFATVHVKGKPVMKANGIGNEQGPYVPIFEMKLRGGFTPERFHFTDKWIASNPIKGIHDIIDLDGAAASSSWMRGRRVSELKSVFEAVGEEVVSESESGSGSESEEDEN